METPTHPTTAALDGIGLKIGECHDTRTVKAIMFPILCQPCAQTTGKGNFICLGSRSCADNSAAKDALDGDISDELIPFSDLGGGGGGQIRSHIMHNYYMNAQTHVSPTTHTRGIDSNEWS